MSRLNTFFKTIDRCTSAIRMGVSDYSMINRGGALIIRKGDFGTLQITPISVHSNSESGQIIKRAGYHINKLEF